MASSESQNAGTPDEGLPLDRLGEGECGTVCRVDAEEEQVARLMTMGVCSGRRVMLVRAGNPMILKVLGTRIGVSARLAACVRVLRCTDDACRPAGS